MRTAFPFVLIALSGCERHSPTKHITELVPNIEAAMATITAFTEGPTVDAEGNVYFTEIINQRIMKMAPDGSLSVFREPSNNANGLIFDSEWRLLACEGASTRGNRPLGFSPFASREVKPRVTRTDMKTGNIEVLAGNFDGKPFVGPNDLTIDSKGRIYFTDLPGGAVYRIDLDGKIARILNAPEIQRPNGIAITPDDKILYLVEANQAENGARVIRSYSLSPDGVPSNMKIHWKFYPGRSADGLCMDSQGNLYAAAGLHRRRGTSETLDTRCGVHVISRQGNLIRFIPIPEDTITNCAFGGPELKTLYVTAGKGVYQAKVDVSGTRR